MAPRYAHAERLALADLLAEVGPDAPTLCEGWTTRDLAAHLVLRDRRPDAGIGVLIGALAGHTAQVHQALRARSWTDLVETVRSGPPFPLRLVDEPLNAVEYFVHHEDVRRASPGTGPRQLDEAMQAVLWRRLKMLGRVAGRKVQVGLDYDWPGHGTISVHRGEPRVTLRGLPSELVLYGFGRRGASEAEVSGDPAALARLDRSTLGL